MTSFPVVVARREHYVTQVRWSDDNRLAVVWSNRAQNASIVTICDVAADSCYSVSIDITLMAVQEIRQVFAITIHDVERKRTQLQFIFETSSLLLLIHFIEQ